MSNQASRRDFLKAGALTGVGFWIAGDAGADEPTTRRRPGPGDRLNVAVIGAGGQGGGNLRAVARTENIVALCDVDDRRAADAYRDFPRATRYHDFRRMLDRERTIDAVVVSTPDHQHAIASITAMRLGKHCYTEKPLTHDVWEARQMKLTARRQRVATQMGNQGTSNSTLREAVEVVRSGAIGDVREIHVWTDRPGTYWRQGFTRPAERQPVPDTMHWDLWLGTAPERPYNSAYAPFAWRGWWDFGTGALGDMACHIMNLPYMALRLGAPTAVSAECDQAVNDQCPPNGLIVTYEFPARRVPRDRGEGTVELPAVRMKWYEVRRPPRDLFHGREIPRSGGSLLVGSRGTLFSPSDYGGSYVLLPQDNFRDYRAPRPTLPRSPGHHAEWLRACKGGAAPLGNFDYSSALTETVLLGNVAIRAGARIVWDSENLRVTNNREANRFIRREYRRGWNIEATPT
jgi:predicted dehydrogenase